jgi:hypothetical protein
LKESTLIFDAFEETYFAARQSDIEDTVHNESFRSHKVVLVSVSQFFDAMFLSEMKKKCYDGVLHLQEIESLTFD